MKFQCISNTPENHKKDSQSHQNEVPRGSWSHQNNENSEKVKSNENTRIYNTFEGLGHQNLQEFPFKNQQKTWLLSKRDFGLLTSEKIWKCDPEWSPMGDPKSIKNLYSMGTESATCAIRRSNIAFLRTPEHVNLCQMIPSGFSLSLGWADHFHEAPQTITEYSWLPLRLTHVVLRIPGYSWEFVSISMDS